MSDDNQRYVISDKDRILRFDTSDFDKYIASKAQRLNQLPGKSAIETIKMNVNALYDDYAVHATVADRIAYQDDTYYYALNENCIVAISPGRVELLDKPQNGVYFYFGDDFIPQCQPDLSTPASALPELIRSTFNISDNYLPAFLAQLVCFYMPNINTPILVLSGGPGTSKSTTSCKVKSLVAPTVVDIQGLPDKIDSLYTSLSHNYLVAYDNVAKITPDYSDLFCIACTSGYVTKRKLYSNNETADIQLHTKMIINGIGDMLSKSDLMERSNIIYLDTIVTRRTDTQVQKEFNELKPRILGAIFNCIKDGLPLVKNMQDNLKNLPRMAEFAVQGAAMIEAMGLDAKKFLRTYQDATTELIGEQMQMDDFTILLKTFLTDHNNTWIGEASTLLNLLKKTAQEHHLTMERYIPATLSRKLGQSEVSLRAAGVNVSRNKARNRSLTLSQEGDFLTPVLTREQKAQSVLQEWVQANTDDENDVEELNDLLDEE